MAEGSSQTYIASWPGVNDRRAPGALAALSGYAAGVFSAVTVAVLLRISVLTKALPMGLYLVAIGSTLCCALCGSVTRFGQPTGLRLLFRFYRDLWENSCLWFTYFAGHGLGLGAILMVQSIFYIGLAYATVFFVAGSMLGGLLVDHFGLGWTHRKVVRPGHLHAALLLVIGTVFLKFDLFRPTGLSLASGLVALIGGILFVFHAAALAEMTPLLGSRAKALAICSLRVVIYLPVWIFLTLPAEARSPILPIHNKELWTLAAAGSVSFALALLCNSVRLPEGATSCHLEQWTAFAVTAVVITALGKSSLPPRFLDLAHGIGLVCVFAALIIAKACSRRARRRQLAAIPNRKHVDDHCDVCLQNDNELSRIQRELLHSYPSPPNLVAAEPTKDFSTRAAARNGAVLAGEN